MQHSNIDLKFVKKKAFPKETDFVKSIRPIYYFSRVFGFLPFSIEFDSKGEVQNARISAFDFLWFVIYYYSDRISPGFGFYLPPKAG